MVLNSGTRPSKLFCGDDRDSAELLKRLDHSGDLLVKIIPWIKVRERPAMRDKCAEQPRNIRQRVRLIIPLEILQRRCVSTARCNTHHAHEVMRRKVHPPRGTVVNLIIEW